MQYPVEVARVETRDVEYRVVAVGSVEAFETVHVTARVQGVVESVRFAEGDQVKPGQTLVEIEPERFRLAVESARAALEKAEAARAEAKAGLARREGATARTPGIIPAEELETWRTRLRTATAEVSEAQSALEQAELNLHDAFARAPVGGIIQTRSVQTGLYVQPGTTLATLLQQEPLLLRFSVPEQDAGNLRPGMRATFTVRESPDAFAARITHVAASADPTSRMVSVTAHVEVTAPVQPAAQSPAQSPAQPAAQSPAPSAAPSVAQPPAQPPRPGAFAEVTVPVGGAVGTPVVPETAVRPSERGFLAYVVEGGKARERILTLGMRTADGRVEVRQGLAARESLVVRGAEALREGAAVRVVAVPSSTPSLGESAGGAQGPPGTQATPGSSP